MTSVTRRHPPVWAFVSAAWLGPAILAVLKEYAQGLLGGGEQPGWHVLVWEAGDWLIYAVLTPAVFWVARRYPLAKGTIARRVPVHLAASIVLCAAWAMGGVLLSWGLFHQPRLQKISVSGSPNVTRAGMALFPRTVRVEYP
jgi:hypothetical protein